MALVGPDEIEAARARVVPVLRPTPSEHCEALSDLCGREVWCKPEHRQRTGSFKIRGAWNRISVLDDDVTEVVAASAGNHAQGVAHAATRSGRRAVVFMPEQAPAPKVDATRDYGGEVRLVPGSVEDCAAAAEAYASEHLLPYVHPFDDPLVIAGQGTIGLELHDEVPEAEVVLVPLGGGGLISGVAAALRAVRPDTRIVGVEADGADAMLRSLRAGRPVRIDRLDTIADGIALKAPSELTLAHVRALVDEVLTVTDEEIARAMLLLLERDKQVVEPAGAVGLAALLDDRVGGSGAAVVVLSGGNVDLHLLGRLITQERPEG